VFIRRSRPLPKQFARVRLVGALIFIAISSWLHPDFTGVRHAAASMMRLKARLTTLLTLTFLTAGQAQTLDKAKLDEFFDRLAGKKKAMGSLTIARDGNVLYTRAIGFSQIDGTERKPLAAESRFRLGSVTKMFTATLILQLVEEGRLKLTDTLDRFLPEIPNAEKITIAQILSHRSGIPNVGRERDAQQKVRTLPIAKEEMLALISNATPEFEPDTRQSYSNTGYFLLGLILEKITGKSYARVLEEKIVSRIGLGGTYLATGNIDINRNEALTYIHFGEDWKPVTETHPTLLFSAGAIVSTAGDMAKFIHALFEGKLVSRDTLDRMKPKGNGEGFGMVTFTFAGRTFYGHTGGADNYGAWLAYEPEEKLAVAYATNAKIYPVGNIVSAVVDIYYHRPFQIPALESIAVKAEVLDRYVGVYSTPGAPAKAKVTRDGSTLFFQPPGESSGVPLEATAEDKFQIEGVAVFAFDAANNQMTVKRRGGERVFTKEK
jgi:D-alanyl-D-alanine carboxypeptidase